MTPDRVPTRQGGFTLMEIIVVVLIFGFMSAMAYGGLNSVLKTRTAVESSIDRTADLQRAYLRMRTDFQNMMLRTIRDNYGDQQPALIGTHENGLEMTRGGWRNPLYLSRGSFERVLYRLVDHKLERSSYRVMDRAQDTQPVRTPLLDRVDDLRFRYMDPNHNWLELWPAQATTQTTQSAPQTFAQPPPTTTAAGQSGQSLPLAVEVTLVTKDLGKLRFLFKPGSSVGFGNLNAVAPSTTGLNNSTGSGSGSDDSGSSGSDASSNGNSNSNGTGNNGTGTNSGNGGNDASPQ